MNLFRLALAALVPATLAACHASPITAQQLADEANKRATFPMDLGDGFRLDAVRAEGNTVWSVVTLTDDALAADARFKEVMRAATVSDICREIAPARQTYADHGLKVGKEYRNSKGEALLRVDVGAADCP